MALNLILLSVAASQASGVNRHLMEQQKPGAAYAHPFCMEGRLAPSVFLIGVQKSGTSSLWHDLIESFPLRAGHAAYDEPLWRDKEISFFSQELRYKQGKSFYLNHFDECKNVHAKEQSLDGSPNTFFEGKRAAKHIKAFYGAQAKDLKFILMVRDPTSRVESAYWHFDPGLEGSFDGYVKKHLPKAKEFTAAGRFEGLPERNTPDSYFTSSLYAKHMKYWLEIFEPSQFAVVTLQQYHEQPTETMQFIEKRTGMKMHHASYAAVHEHKREHPHMSKETRVELAAFYEPFNKEFDQMVAENGMGFGDEEVSDGFGVSKSSRFHVTEGKKSILMEVQATDEATMDAATEETLRLEHGMFSPDKHNPPIEAYSDLYEEMHGDAMHP